MDESSPSREDGVVRTPEVERRLALLWEGREVAGRGRKARFTLDEVVDAGIRVAVRDGLNALSMRRVAAELGVGAMTLYTYVPGRAELIDLMVDRVYSTLDLPGPDDSWREGMAVYAREHYRMYLQHPWLLQTNMWRTPLSPHVLDAEEAGLRTLIDTGLTEVAVVRVVGLVDTLVRGTARAAVAEAREADATGQDVDDYWESMSSVWVDYFDEQRYPTMTRVYEAGAFDDAGDPLELALENLLATIDVLIERNAEQASESSSEHGSGDGRG